MKEVRSFLSLFSRIPFLSLVLDQLIYPGKTTVTDCFRIGNIGRLFESDMQYLAHCIEQVCREMNIDLPLKAHP